MDMEENSRKKENFMNKAITEYEAAFQEYEAQKNRFAEEIQKTIELNKFKEGKKLNNNKKLICIEYEAKRNKDVEEEIQKTKQEHQSKLSKMALKHKQELTEIKVKY